MLFCFDIALFPKNPTIALAMREAATPINKSHNIISPHY